MDIVKIKGKNSVSQTRHDAIRRALEHVCGHLGVEFSSSVKDDWVISVTDADATDHEIILNAAHTFVYAKGWRNIIGVDTNGKWIHFTLG